jgi:hypothetical protein
VQTIKALDSTPNSAMLEVGEILWHHMSMSTEEVFAVVVCGRTYLDDTDMKNVRNLPVYVIAPIRRGVDDS